MLDPVLRDDLDHHVKAHEAELIEFRRALHQHPELGREEHRTTAALVARLVDAGLQPRVLSSGTGVICDVIGSRGERPTVAFRGDIDALPLNDAKDVPYRSQSRRRVPRLRARRAHCGGARYGAGAGRARRGGSARHDRSG